MQFIVLAHTVNTLVLQNQEFHMEARGRVILCKDTN